VHDDDDTKKSVLRSWRDCGYDEGHQQISSTHTGWMAGFFWPYFRHQYRRGTNGRLALRIAYYFTISFLFWALLPPPPPFPGLMVTINALKYQTETEKRACIVSKTMDSNLSSCNQIYPLFILDSSHGWFFPDFFDAQSTRLHLIDQWPKSTHPKNLSSAVTARCGNASFNSRWIPSTSMPWGLQEHNGVPHTFHGQ